jgi:nucleoside-diphosphate-sugar epimerase
MAGKKIFLTGATGNVGRAVLPELVQQGYDVLALVRRTVPDVKGYRPVFADLSKVQDVTAEIAMAGGVIHCASPRTNHRPTVLRDDIEATARLLDAWSSGPFVYMSSQTVYGIPTTILREEAPLEASCWYDMGKICNEYQVAMQSQQGGRGVGINLRLPLVFATGPRRRDRQFLPGLLDALRANRPLLFGSDEALETSGSVFIGEGDLGRAVVDSLSIRRSGAYNFASGFCTWKTLIEKLAARAGLRPSFKIRAGAVAQDTEYRLPQSRSYFDCTRFEGATGFQPRQSLDEIIDRFMRAEAGSTSPGSLSIGS